MIHPPNDGMGAKDNDLPVAADQTLTCGCAQMSKRGGPVALDLAPNRGGNEHSSKVREQIQGIGRASVLSGWNRWFQPRLRILEED